jgi:LAS superfamily LD-carboxypeptidase LdcB
MTPLYYIAVALIGLVIFMPRRALGYVGGNEVSIAIAPIGQGFDLRIDAADAFNRMKQQATLDGINLVVNSAFRTWEEQESLWNLWLAKMGNRAARPGYSNHQNGLAVDINVGGNFSTPVYYWLQTNAPYYGFDNVEGIGIGEPHHWVYTKGIANA